MNGSPNEDGSTNIPKRFGIGKTGNFSYNYMGVSKTRWCFPSKSSILIGFGFPYFHHPFWGYHYFWTHPYSHCLIGRAPKGNSSSSHPFSGAKMLVSGRATAGSPKNHPSDRENHLNQSFIFGFQPFVFSKE